MSDFQAPPAAMRNTPAVPDVDREQRLLKPVKDEQLPGAAGRHAKQPQPLMLTEYSDSAGLARMSDFRAQPVAMQPPQPLRLTENSDSVGLTIERRPGAVGRHVKHPSR